jgi:Flp pilus assembly protein TadG
MVRLKRRAGSELIEFALVLPLLVLLVFGIVDFSLAIYDKAVVTNASREGARAGIAATPRPTFSDIQLAVTNYCKDRLVSFDGATTCTVVEPNPFPSVSGDPLPVQVQSFYHYGLLSSLSGLASGLGFTLDSLNLTTTTVMQLQ